MSSCGYLEISQSVLHSVIWPNGSDFLKVARRGREWHSRYSTERVIDQSAELHTFGHQGIWPIDLPFQSVSLQPQDRLYGLWKEMVREKKWDVGITVCQRCHPPAGGWRSLKITTDFQVTEINSVGENGHGRWTLWYCAPLKSFPCPDIDLLRLHFQNFQIFPKMELATL